MHEKQPKTDSFGLRDAIYLALGILAIGISWREWSRWRLAVEVVVEEVQGQQKTLLGEIRSLQKAVAALDKKVSETTAVKASPTATTPKAPRKPRRKKTDENINI